MNKKKKTDRVVFTKEMKKTHTILFPDMLPVHFEIIRHVFAKYGYQTEVLHNAGKDVIDTGLKYVHNDTCYPALLVIGQFINALQSGKYDLDRTALMITQTGGGCRASNYIFLLFNALKTAGLERILVISLYMSGLESIPGFRRGFTLVEMRRLFREIADGFAAVPQERRSKIRVGVVGEIYVKFSSLGNNGLEKFLLEQGCEVMLPGVMGFVMYSLSNQEVDRKLYGGKAVVSRVAKAALRYLEAVERAMLDAIQRPGCFTAPSPFAHLEKLGERVINRGSKMGEGWLLTAETLELIENGYPNDYDSGAASVNQENRIKLMLSSAKRSGDPTAAFCEEQLSHSGEHEYAMT